jgi:hypothetical protein
MAGIDAIYVLPVERPPEGGRLEAPPAEPRRAAGGGRW